MIGAVYSELNKGLSLYQIFIADIEQKKIQLDGKELQIYVHCSYQTVLTRFWSVKYFADQLRAAEKINAKGIVIHLPKNIEEMTDDTMKIVAKYLKLATPNSPIYYFEHIVGNLTKRDNFDKIIKDIQDLAEKVNKNAKVRGCIDTCHIYASGVDIRDYYDIENVLVHLNDSVHGFNSGLDRHATLGTNLFSSANLKKFIENIKADNYVIELKDAKSSFEFLKENEINSC